jgi:hypothetical protein
MLNQRTFTNHRYATLAEIKAVANANVQTLCFCQETETLYRYDLTSGATADDQYILITGAGGTTRWIGIAGKYAYPVTGAPFGEMYLTATSAVAVGQDPTYTELGGTTALGDAVDFDMPANNRLRYTGELTRKFKITTSLAVSSSGADTYKYRIARSSTTIAKSQIPRFMSGVNDTGAIPVSCVIELAKNQYVGIWGTRTAVPARNVTMEALNMIAQPVN